MKATLLGSEDNFNWLERKAHNWALSVVELYNTQVPPSMEEEKKALLNKAKTIKQTIEKVTGPIDALAPLEPVVQQLGIIPIIIGVVGASAAAAAITYWYTSYKKFKEKLSLQDRLMSDGVPAAQAAMIVADTYGSKSLAEKLFNPKAFLPIVIVGGIIWFASKR